MKRLACFTLLALLLFSTTACTNQANTITPVEHPIMSTTPSDCPENPPTVVPMPMFLRAIYPTGAIKKTEFEKTLTEPIFRGIQIKISADGLDRSVLNSKDIDYRINAISDRVTLFIDEVIIPNDKTTLTDGLIDAGPFYLSWPVKLNTGSHTAKLVFDTESGDIINYLWTFCILP